jgi:hypothetical protein
MQEDLDISPAIGDGLNTARYSIRVAGLDFLRPSHDGLMALHVPAP